MSHIYLALVLPDAHNAPSQTQAPPSVILRGSAARVPWGRNGILFANAGFRVEAVWSRRDDGTWVEAPTEPFGFEFNFLSRSQIQRSDIAFGQLAKITGRPLQGDLEHLHPLVAVVGDPKGGGVYHFADMDHRGSIFVRYETVSDPVETPEAVERAMSKAGDALRIARRSANDACNHGRWKADMEFERKFTFTHIPDIWRLINSFYQRVLSGQIEGFVHEVGLDFQVFDYEAKIFEVLEPREGAGYIAFIPQSNGKVCVKRKWFQENAELRRETLDFNQAVGPADMEEHARKMCGGRVRALPTYRRKRVDVNFESLETGNVYGVFFDICRTTDTADPHAFAQCEVEYCRSRTFGPLTEVVEQFEHACAVLERFLQDEGVAYTQDLYSKLDFVRDAANKEHQVA